MIKTVVSKEEIRLMYGLIIYDLFVLLAVLFTDDLFASLVYISMIFIPTTIYIFVFYNKAKRNAEIIYQAVENLNKCVYPNEWRECYRSFSVGNGFYDSSEKYAGLCYRISLGFDREVPTVPNVPGVHYDGRNQDDYDQLYTYGKRIDATYEGIKWNLMSFFLRNYLKDRGVVTKKRKMPTDFEVLLDASTPDVDRGESAASMAITKTIIVMVIVIALLLAWAIRKNNKRIESYNSNATSATDMDFEEYPDDVKENNDISDVIQSEEHEDHNEDAENIEKSNNNADNKKKHYILPFSDSRYVKIADLKKLSKWKCKLARNEIYARHGRKFNDKKLQKYFNSKLWYDGYIEPDDFDEAVEFNKYEKKNARTILKYENSLQ